MHLVVGLGVESRGVPMRLAEGLGEVEGSDAKFAQSLNRGCRFGLHHRIRLAQVLK
jgi:hypothetical protein